MNTGSPEDQPHAQRRICHPPECSWPVDPAGADPPAFEAGAIGAGPAIGGSPSSDTIRSRHAAAWRRVGGALVGLVGLLIVAGTGFVLTLGPAPTGAALEFSKLVVDRNGQLLRPYATREGRWRLPVDLASVDPRFVDALIAYEDKRFRRHHGVDLWALTRAALQFIVNGRIVSGGSTLTMQVARLLEPRRERSLKVKLREIVRAIELESVLSKNEILGLYLNLAPYGGNLEGVRSASLAYFGKEPKRLGLAEAALLVALPQSPELRRPDRRSGTGRGARDRVLERISAAALYPRDEIELAKKELFPTGRRAMPSLSPHAADRAVAANPGRDLLRLTIDADLQRRFEELARERAHALGPELSIALMAVDNATGEVIARVGSADYFDERRAGQVDMTEALRSPGSTLKPFIYGLAFEDGLVHPETLIEDRPVRYGAYAPENFDLTFQGTVSVRRALQMSLNVPAVMLLDAVRASRLTSRLATAGARLTLPSGEVPGLAIGLGGVGVRFSDLVMLYAGLARLGSTVPLVEWRDDGYAAAAPRRLLDPAAAWYVGNVLMGTPPPQNAAAGRVAFKTGTSYGYRDAWSIGFDGKHTIGVWVGRPDGAPVPSLTGRSAAAPILFDAFGRLQNSTVPLPSAPKGIVFASNSRLPPPLQRFRPGGLPPHGADPPHIVFPPNGARLEVADRSGLEPVALKVSGGSAPLTLLVNGAAVETQAYAQTMFFQPDGLGFMRLTVVDAHGAADSVVVRLQ